MLDSVVKQAKFLLGGLIKSQMNLSFMSTGPQPQTLLKEVKSMLFLLAEDLNACCFEAVGRTGWIPTKEHVYRRACRNEPPALLRITMSQNYKQRKRAFANENLAAIVCVRKTDVCLAVGPKLTLIHKRIITLTGASNVPLVK